MSLILIVTVGASGTILIFGLLLGLRRTARRQRTRHPLTRELLRSPGHTVREAIDDMSLDILADAMIMITVSWMAATGVAVLQRTGGGTLHYSLVAAGLVATFLIIGMRLVRGFKRRQKFRLGLDAELATGEELNQLMLLGCRVYHDFPAERVNIDHVIIGPAGVFAVETKGRAKPQRGVHPEHWSVRYDGHRLQFPGWEEREPLEQARRQATWLGKWLSRAVGEEVTVQPALALPGWKVERPGRGDIIVFNPRNATFLAQPRYGKELSPQHIERIALHVEQRCRDVAPRAAQPEEASSTSGNGRRR